MYCGGMGEVPDPVVLDHPVLGWVAGGVTAEDVLDGEAGGDWQGRPCHALPCPGSPSPPAGIGPRWRQILAAEHAAPSPFCTCGLAVDPDAPAGRWRDRYRDRLGYRMQTAALVVTWGRVIVERDGVRGQHGLVLALLACDDDSPQRRRRITHAARMLGAELIEIAPEVRPPDFRAIADEIGAPFGRRLERADAAALLRRRDVRRWQSLNRYEARAAASGAQMVVIGACLALYGLIAIGVPAVASAAVVAPPATALTVGVTRRAMRALVQVEAQAPAVAGQPPAGEPIALAPPRRLLGPPADAADWIRNTLE